MVIALAEVGSYFAVPLLVPLYGSAVFSEEDAPEVNVDGNEDDVQVADDCPVDDDDHLEVDSRHEDQYCRTVHQANVYNFVEADPGAQVNFEYLEETDPKLMDAYLDTIR